MAANERWQLPWPAMEVEAGAAVVARHSRTTLVVTARTSSESWLLRAMTPRVRSVVASILNGGVDKGEHWEEEDERGEGRRKIVDKLRRCSPPTGHR